MPGTGDKEYRLRKPPQWRATEGARRQKLLPVRSGCSLSASAVLNIQWRHVLDSACRLAAANHMFPRRELDSVSKLAFLDFPPSPPPPLSLSLSTVHPRARTRASSFSVLHVRFPSASCCLVPLDGLSFHSNVHRCSQRNFLISLDTSDGQEARIPHCESRAREHGAAQQYIRDSGICINRMRV